MFKISSPNLTEDDWKNQNELQFSLNLLCLSLRVKFGFIFLFLILSPSLIQKITYQKFNELAKPKLPYFKMICFFSFVAKNWKRADEHQLKFYLFFIWVESVSCLFCHFFDEIPVRFSFHGNSISSAKDNNIPWIEDRLDQHPDTVQIFLKQYWTCYWSFSSQTRQILPVSQKVSPPSYFVN